MKEKCIFCEISNGNIPSKKILETENVLALLDVNPVSEGHTLVIPKKHYENIFDIDKEILKEISEICQKLSNLFKEKLKCEGVNILNASGKVAQQSVFHLHFHVVPRYSNDKLNLWFHQEANKNIDLNKVFNKISNIY
ncbi:HIT family protein [Candidatus Woesearchaeota archaeon]|nr:HIT family protein [Candidatus Woesearchaeota archaeon]USN44760.1 MAG: HIT family protein [Candidatus Woesearchaeota archaeon]